MKKIIIMALAVLWGAGTMSAQRGGQQRMSTENRVARMTKQLNLTEEQQQKITAIYKDFESKRKEGERPNREKMMEEMKKVDEQVNSVLTDEQKKIYEELKQARMKRQPRTRFNKEKE